MVRKRATVENRRSLQKLRYLIAGLKDSCRELKSNLNGNGTLASPHFDHPFSLQVDDSTMGQGVSYCKVTI